MTGPAHRVALALAIVAASLGPALGQPAIESLEQDQAAALQAKQDLQARIKSVQEQLERRNKEFRRASDQLRQSELAISDATRRLKDLQAAIARGEQALETLTKKIAQTNADLDRDRSALASQLRAQHSSNLSPWSALLAGKDPQSLGKELGYLSFVADARVKTIERLNKGVAELSALQATQTEQQQLLAKQQQEVQAEQTVLRRERQARADLLAKLEGSIAVERAERDKLVQDEKQLTALIEGLGQQIAKFQADAQHANAIRQEILEALPQGEGLKRGISMPIKGAILARYGSSRPDGGDWRGVLIDAKPGTPVKAVAAGTVVYATWLRGFGNLIIVDHADEFLTVYAYNQSLLKEVGDTVKAGDVIANAGNTGGQLDSALYFEVRHRGKPLDPMLYFKR
ncbi:murein hydrolase activator EnvC family protein [Orrella daihaiensis]|uniref:Peptidoglycan DD-metalloendopeptidase family protein n=1 Tax=Orrella daihaiensis TaxID=2782176 RepID=A0ABY4AMN4_9BURK|nr:peptidoglycan DD-metalloendopeptidase family protein [Orrella daihaiensis]UOD50645.1 peptidoglycan DD-metalloendopeptidase family protein [Orrella daihaiensis]